jgi:hypothetical protein
MRLLAYLFQAHSRAKDVHRGESRPGAGAIYPGPAPALPHTGPGSPLQGLFTAIASGFRGCLSQAAIKWAKRGAAFELLDSGSRNCTATNFCASEQLRQASTADRFSD